MTIIRTSVPLIIYDGTCGFCTWSVTQLRQHLPATVDARPHQHLDLTSYGLTQRDVETAAWWVGPDGSRRRGAQVFAAWLRASGGAWAVAGRVLSVPPMSWLAAVGYRVIARNRHRIPGPWEHTCALPPRDP